MPQNRTWTAVALSASDTGTLLERWEFIIDNSDTDAQLSTRALVRAWIRVVRDDGRVSVQPTDWTNLDDVPDGVISSANRAIIKQGLLALNVAGASVVESKA